ncbi:polyprenal reductase-like [Haliotis cracherodii]|uniref:polyprenal reductase-like n=1 Tax=Haliotis cracherodii TaxID=6455 RepID=UPI0039ECEEC2
MAVSVGSGLWIILTLAVVLFYFLVFDVFPKVELLARLFLIGKLREKGNRSKIFNLFDVPKRWFTHFYMLGVVVNTSLLILLARVVVFRVPFPQPVQNIFNTLWAPNHTPEGVSGTAVVLVLVMEELQVLRRCYECLFVSVFSDSKISVVHYIMGLLLYLTFGSCILASTDFNNFRMTGVDQMGLVCVVVGCFLFFLASMLQHQTLHILSKLRKSHSGVVENRQHLLPNGGLFEYVSCPHFFTEILIYLAMNIVVQFQHQACLSIGIFVLVNQVIMSLMTHDWYRKNFRMFPKDRKAVFPYLL